MPKLSLSFSLSEIENGQTTLRSINEAVRNLGRTTPAGPDAHSANVSSSNKRPGDWTFVPRSTQSVRNPTRDDRQSTKTGNSAWKGGLSRVLSFSRKPDDPPSRSVKIKVSDISNPIPHPRSLETAERIGTDLEIARRHHRQLSNYTSSEIEVPPTANEVNRRIFDNPIMLEDKDFDSASEASDYSPPSSPSPISTPSDLNPAPSADMAIKHPYARAPLTQSPIQTTTTTARPPAPRSPQGSFCRPTPSAYPMLLRQYLDTQGQSTDQLSPVIQTSSSPTLPRSPTGAYAPNTSRALPTPPTRPARPPIPSRNPARYIRGTYSEDGYDGPSHPAAWMVRKSPSHGAIRI